MADMELIIKIPEEMYQKIKQTSRFISGRRSGKRFDYILFNAVNNGTPLPKGHSFIAICDSDFPITEEVKQELKNTAFVGNEDCHYCFDMTEIIEADKEEGSDKE